MNYLGYKELLKRPLTAFLSSDSDDAKINGKIAEWGDKITQNPKITVLSGFQSTGERILLDKILSGKASAIILLARCMFKKCPEEYQKAVNEGRLLIVSDIDDETITKVDFDRAFERNMRVVNGGKQVVIGYVKKNGMVQKVLDSSQKPYILL